MYQRFQSKFKFDLHFNHVFVGNIPYLHSNKLLSLMIHELWAVCRKTFTAHLEFTIHSPRMAEKFKYCLEERKEKQSPFVWL